MYPMAYPRAKAIEEANVKWKSYSRKAARQDLLHPPGSEAMKANMKV